MPPASESRFERNTRVAAAGEHVFEAHIDPGWWVVEGPNGGYVAAILLRALTSAVADPERAPRSLSIHYTARPAEGPVQIATQIERRGRSLTTATAHMSQGGRLLCLAVAAFSKVREGFGFTHAQMPEVAPPENCDPLPEQIEIHKRFDYRWAVGALPFAGSGQAVCGGWIRLTEPHVADAPLVAAYADAFPPAIFSLVQDGDISGGVPTIDLTIHFRETLPLAGAADDDFVLAVFRSRQAHEGFIEEDGEIWSRDGALLAHSRQLALLL
jgi:acyl-CoA thioesterase